MPGMVATPVYPVAWEVESGGSEVQAYFGVIGQVRGQSEIYETLV